jgi:hypothetical protein
MSMNLYWQPITDNWRWLPYALKRVISDKFFNGVGGSLTMGETLLPWLQGLADAGVEGSPELMGAIEKHGLIEIEVR